MALVAVEGLSKRYRAPGWRGVLGTAPAVTALSGVSLSAEAGRVVAVVGPNGAGKTTLFKILATLVLPTAGTVRVDGLDPDRDSVEVRRRVGLVTADERSFSWRLDARQNLLFFAALHDMSGPTALARVDELIEATGLAGVASRPFRTWSTGERQRLALARALLHGPPVLLLDEPTRSLDPEGALAVRALIRRQARDEGRLVLLATHDLDEAWGLADEVVVLSGGRVADDGSPADLTSRHGGPGAGPEEVYRACVAGQLS